MDYSRRENSYSQTVSPHDRERENYVNRCLAATAALGASLFLGFAIKDPLVGMVAKCMAAPIVAGARKRTREELSDRLDSEDERNL